MFNPSGGKSVLLVICTSLLLFSAPAAFSGNSQKAHEVVDILLDSGSSTGSSSRGYSGPVVPSLKNALNDLERAEKTLMGIKSDLGKNKKRALNNLRKAIGSVKKSVDYAEKNL